MIATRKTENVKSGNVDPLEICDKFGTDAVRTAFSRMGAPGTDIAVSDCLLDSYRFSPPRSGMPDGSFRSMGASDRCRRLKNYGTTPGVGHAGSGAPRPCDTGSSRFDGQYNLHENHRAIYRFSGTNSARQRYLE
jgi:hypothetical protein